MKEAGRENGNKNSDDKMSALRERTSEPERAQQSRKTEISLQQPGVPPPKFCGRIYQEGMGSKGKRAGSQIGH